MVDVFTSFLPGFNQLTLNNEIRPVTCAASHICATLLTCVQFSFDPPLNQDYMYIICAYNIVCLCLVVAYSEHSLIRHNSFSKNIID